MNDSTPTPEFDRLDELLAGQALHSLSEQETRELDHLIEQVGDRDAFEEEAARYEELIAAVDFAIAPTPSEPLPPALAERLLAEAPRHLPPVGNERPSTSETPPRSQPVVRRNVSLREVMSLREVIAWTIAGLSLMIAALVWWDSPTAPASAPTVSEQVTSLLETEGTIVSKFTPGPTPVGTEATGDVVWNNDRQQGYLRLTNLPVNDPQQTQYQLWIIDPERDEQPIDGGVFDITADGEAIIPINAKLAVIDPVAFAITIEQPGGVVVSDQTNLPLLAKVGT